MIIKTVFDIGDRVKIIELEREGRVNSFHISGSGGGYIIKYEVRYFDNGLPQNVYFYEDEIEKIKVKKTK